jgi:MtN3 and saliva related transmembrane protein
MHLIDWIGIVAGVATTSGFIPQAMKIYKTRKTKDISLGMYSLFTAGVFLWIVYGIFLGSFPLILFNSITLVLAAYVLFMKIKHG